MVLSEYIKEYQTVPTIYSIKSAIIVNNIVRAVFLRDTEVPVITGKKKNPKMYPPVGPISAGIPDLNPENTGMPTIPRMR